MSDPAVEAAQRACSSYLHSRRTGNPDVDHPRRCLEAAAREALGPIRDLHRPEPYAQGPDYCMGCDSKWPCETAKLAYTTEELMGHE